MYNKSVSPRDIVCKKVYCFSVRVAKDLVGVQIGAFPGVNRVAVREDAVANVSAKRWEFNISRVETKLQHNLLFPPKTPARESREPKLSHFHVWAGRLS